MNTASMFTVGDDQLGLVDGGLNDFYKICIGIAIFGSVAGMIVASGMAVGYYINKK